MADRSSTLRVPGTMISLAACSQLLATSILNRQVRGASASVPPRIPVSSSFGAVEPMGIDRGGARLQPNRGWPGGSRNGLADGARRVDSRFFDLLLVPGSVPAVDIATGQIDHDVRPVDFRGPLADVRCVPPNDEPGSLGRSAAQHNDVMAVRDEGAGKQSADLAGASGDHNLHGVQVQSFVRVQSFLPVKGPR